MSRTVVLRPVGIGGLLRDVLRRPRNQAFRCPRAAEEPSESIPCCSATPQEQRTKGATRRDALATSCICLRGMTLGSSRIRLSCGTPSAGSGNRRKGFQDRAVFFNPRGRAEYKMEASRSQRPASTLPIAPERNRVLRSGSGRPTSLLPLQVLPAGGGRAGPLSTGHPADEPRSATGWEAQRRCRAA